MGVVGGAVRNAGKTVNRAATATTATAGAVGGAAVNGIVGGVTGAAEGIKKGIHSGSHSTNAATHSTPAAALAIGALGVAGLVEWPVLLAVGGGALLLQRLNRKPEPKAVKANLKPVPSEPASAESTPQKRPAQKAGA